MDAFSYGIGIYLAQEVWSGVICDKFHIRKKKAWNKRSMADSICPLEKTMIREREAYHMPQNIHGVGPLTFGRTITPPERIDEDSTFYSRD